MEVVAALPAVGLRVLQPEEAELGGALEDRVGKPARPLPLARVGTQLRLREAADRLAELSMLVGEELRRQRVGASAQGNGWLRTPFAKPLGALPMKVTLSRVNCGTSPHWRTRER
jgi:hypothetical protein